MNDMIEDSMAASEAVETAIDRPADLPDKFWDPDAGQVRVDALAKSYGELERRLGAGSGIPESPDAYEHPRGRKRHSCRPRGQCPSARRRVHQRSGPPGLRTGQ